jgi:hypothetical protein
MADNNVPNQAANESKAEGDRDAGGITNRPLGEELENQNSLPDRGKSREGAHAGHGDEDRDDRRSER